ncbi:MAG: pyridoxamine kinase [Erysipelotrichaceae bacterium]|nr:pyridoxamine kinase [Erysipelotrichaceae bacterium]
MKRIVTMQDISCVGKCSLTVALPVISAMGVEAAVIPTAVLSTHTMFKGFTFHDLTGEIEPIMAHWKKEGFDFDAVYTGYLGSFEQLNIASHLFEQFGSGVMKIVDPCMADNGKLYAGFTKEFAAAMKDLCAKADIICPNLTEASFLLDIPYRTEYDEAYIRDVLKQLTALGCKKAVLTGISFEGGILGAYSYDAGADVFYSYFTIEEREHFHGTGDIWASTLCGALVNGKSFEEAIRIACDYVRECIHVTLAEENHNTYGVNFEQAIPYLIQRLNG